MTRGLCLALLYTPPPRSTSSQLSRFKLFCAGQFARLDVQSISFARWRQYSKDNGITRPSLPDFARLDSFVHHQSALEVLQFAVKANPGSSPRQVRESMVRLRRLGRLCGTHGAGAPSEARCCGPDRAQHRQLERSADDQDHLLDPRRVSQGMLLSA